MSNHPEAELIVRLVNLHTRLQKTMASAMTPHGISLSEYMVLLQLHAAPERSMRRIDLAQAVGLTASGITRMINPMEKIGLVQKQANARDARVSLVQLSTNGAQVFLDSRRSFEDAAEGLLRSLDAGAKEQLSGLLTSLG